MDVRVRRLIIAVPAVITLAAIVAVVVLVLLQRQQQAEQVDAADEVAQTYLADVSTFRTKTAEAITSVAGDGPAAIAAVVDEQLADPPTLADAPAHGRENSLAYHRAEEVEESLLDPYESLDDVLAEASRGVRFVEAAEKVLKLRPSDYLGTTSVTSSVPVRATLLPAYERALSAFDAVAVPKGQEDVAASVHDAVQYVIDNATTLADRIEVGQSFSFTFDDQYEAAFEAVNGYATKVEGDVAEAISAVPSGRQGTAA